jgi:Lsr2
MRRDRLSPNESENTMKKLIVIVKDDFDNTLVADTTVPFTFGGTDYEIDLTAENAEKFAADMARYIAAGRKVKRSHKRKKPSATNGEKVMITPDQHMLDKPHRTKIRQWALDNDFEQGVTGLIRQEVLDAYFQAHPDEAREIRR